jgi:hypothetical protein
MMVSRKDKPWTAGTESGMSTAHPAGRGRLLPIKGWGDYRPRWGIGQPGSVSGPAAGRPFSRRTAVQPETAPPLFEGGPPLRKHAASKGRKRHTPRACPGVIYTGGSGLGLEASKVCGLGIRYILEAGSVTADRADESRMSGGLQWTAMGKRRSEG